MTALINKHSNYRTTQTRSNKVELLLCVKTDKGSGRYINSSVEEHSALKPSLFPSQDAFLVIAAILFFVLCVYAFFYLNLSTEINLDVDVD